MILGIHHVQITIPEGSDEQARDFYCGILGLPEIEKPDTLKHRGGLWVQAGDRQLHIGTEHGVDRSLTRAHIAWEVTDLSHWRARLARSGVQIVDSIPIPGFDRFEFRDPFGNRVEMIQQTRERDAQWQ